MFRNVYPGQPARWLPVPAQLNPVCESMDEIRTHYPALVDFLLRVIVNHPEDEDKYEKTVLRTASFYSMTESLCRWNCALDEKGRALYRHFTAYAKQNLFKVHKPSDWTFYHDLDATIRFLNEAFDLTEVLLNKGSTPV